MSWKVSSAQPTEGEWRALLRNPAYLVSPHGEVWSRFTRRLLTRTTRKDGYVTAQIGKQAVKVHQLVAEAYLGPKPKGTEVRHFDGDPSNNHRSNLLYGTHVENMDDMMRHGRHAWKRRTHCSQGHEYTAANTVYRPSRPNSRVCRECQRERHAKFRASKQSRRIAA